jgi:aspartate dehydrogenase
VTALRVGILGWGAIGSAIAERLLAGAVADVELTAVASRTPPGGIGVPVVAPAELAECCDLVIETAGHGAVAEHLPGLLAAGCRVIMVSTGALRDSDLLEAVARAGADRLMLSSGAIGGIDIVGACRHAGEIRSIRLTTTKPPAVLIQPWMDDKMTAALQSGEKTVTCFDGTALDAAEKFPASANVAATLALAAWSWDLIHVTVIGDPAATGNRHAIDIDADAGTYRIELANNALASNPKSSALVVGSVLRGLEALTSSTRSFA